MSDDDEQSSAAALDLSVNEYTDLQKYLTKRNALFADITPTTTMAWWRENMPAPPDDPLVPMMMAHKARLQWLGATDQQLADSLAWCKANDCNPDLKGAPPLTPAKRDADRVSLGMSPLGQIN